jgi:hypothetical protein
MATPIARTLPHADDPIPQSASVTAERPTWTPRDPYRPLSPADRPVDYCEPLFVRGARA